jgi:hypothetical protein
VTVVPEPPEALTDDVGPSPEVVVCEPEVLDCVVVDVVGSVAEAVVPVVVESDAFDPVSESAEPDGWSSPVLADATPWPEATAIPRPTAKANPLARFARGARFACFARFAEDMTCSDSPEWRFHGTRKPGHEMLINSGAT